MSVAPAPPISTIPKRSAQAASLDFSRESLNAGRLRKWATKSLHSLADHGFTSLTNFSVSFLLARWMSAEVYGAYAIAFAGYLFVCGLHNVVLLEPLSVIGPARHAAHFQTYFRTQIVVHFVLAGILSTVVALAGLVVWRNEPQSQLVGAILGSALALPFLLFLWLARRMCYVLHRPLTAILGSGSCLVLVLLGLYALRHFGKLGPFPAFLLLGAGSLAGSLLVLCQLGIGGLSAPRGARGAALTWLSILLENWSYGRWLIGTAILYPISGQVQMFLVAAFLGLGSAGVLRAMMLPASVMTQVVSATDLLVLPGLSRDFGHGLLRRMRQKAVLVSGTLGAAGLGFVVLLRFIAGPAEHFLFGGKFAPYVWLIPVLALIPAANGFNSGFSAALRGSQRPHFDLIANALAAPVAVITAIGFIHWWGLAGAAISLVAGYATLAVANFCSYCYFVRRVHTHEAASAPSAFSIGNES
jgi:O-antigen/teichoic acid export membrane protein